MPSHFQISYTKMLLMRKSFRGRWNWYVQKYVQAYYSNNNEDGATFQRCSRKIHTANFWLLTDIFFFSSTGAVPTKAHWLGYFGCIKHFIILPISFHCVSARTSIDWDFKFGFKHWIGGDKRNQIYLYVHFSIQMLLQTAVEMQCIST